MREEGRADHRKGFKLPICPLGLTGQMNGIYYWYAEDCPTHTPFLVQTEEELQTGCRDDNQDCQRLFTKSSHPSLSDDDPGCAFLRDSNLRENGLAQPLSLASPVWFGPGTTQAEWEDRDLVYGGARMRIRLFSLLYHPPHKLGDAGMNRVVKIGIGQELDAAPGGTDEGIVIEGHEVGDCYFKVRSGDRDSGNRFHVMVMKR